MKVASLSASARLPSQRLIETPYPVISVYNGSIILSFDESYP